MKLKYNFLIQPVGDNFMAVCTNGEDADFKGMVKLNLTGKRIFEILKEETDFNTLVNMIAEEFEGDRQEIETSVASFVIAMQTRGLISED